MAKGRSRSIVAVLLLVSLPMGYVACTQQNDARLTHLNSRDDDAGHGLHTVNNERLREIMHGLSALEMERLQADAAGGADTNARIERVARAASQLAADARVMPAAFKDMEMNAESRRVFDNLAVRLQSQCTELELLARARKTDALKPKMNEITQTCNACHASFRGPQTAMGR